MAQYFPKAWTLASSNKIKAKAVNKVEGRSSLRSSVDMSEEVAGQGRCPACRGPMKISNANGSRVWVCLNDRVVLPVADDLIVEDVTAA